jgi:hypothetical protein
MDIMAKTNKVVCMETKIIVMEASMSTGNSIIAQSGRVSRTNI